MNRLWIEVFDRVLDNTLEQIFFNKVSGRLRFLEPVFRDNFARIFLRYISGEHLEKVFLNSGFFALFSSGFWSIGIRRAFTFI